VLVITTLDTRRLVVPVWVMVVGLVAVVQPPTTVGAGVFLLFVLGIVAPAIWLILLGWRRHAFATRRSERREN
jgi:hypothetical protein